MIWGLREFAWVCVKTRIYFKERRGRDSHEELYGAGVCLYFIDCSRIFWFLL